MNKQVLYSMNSERYNLTSQTLDLFFRDHQFESHKSQGHWRFKWSLISKLVRLVKVDIN